MDRYVVAGNPVAQSQSPFIHAEFARQTGQAMDYGRLLCPLDGFAQAMAHLAAEGAKACNITMPFKFEAAQLATTLSPRVALAQAANVLVFERCNAADKPGWVADNTDGVGLVRDLQHNAGLQLQHKRVLLLGAGGAAAGVLGPLLEAGPRTLVVANRTASKAMQLIDRHHAVAHRCGVALQACALVDCVEPFDVVLNATASSLLSSTLVLPSTVCAPGTLALDMAYGPPAQAFLSWAARHGAVTRDGLGMLVEQAAAAFELWRGVRPHTAPVLAALRKRLTAPTG
jgi:shikimate dehydrogenase